MGLPRISRRRRRWLGAHLSGAARRWVEARDPFYLQAESADVVARSIEIVRARARVQAAPDRVFCDLGFNNRLVFDQFYDGLGAEFRWFGFEVQPVLHAEATAAASEGRYDAASVEFVHAAAADRDGTVSFALEGKADGKHPFDGTTTMASLARDPGAPKLEAPAVDLARFLLERTREASVVVVKMDVEGAEYGLLRHLLASPVAARIDLILCEFHWRRFPFPEKVARLFETEALKARYAERGAQLLSWR
jgi:FkbM family methyltransferase